MDIREYSTDKHLHVDDYPYGGGAGMVMQPEPVYRAFLDIKEKTGKKEIRVVYLTPQGKVFKQEMAQEFSKEEDIIFLCGSTFFKNSLSSFESSAFSSKSALLSKVRIKDCSLLHFSIFL